MSHDEGTTTEGSDESVGCPEEPDYQSDLRHPPLRTRFTERARGLGQQVGGDLHLDWREATTGAKVLMVTGAAAIAYCGVRGVMAAASLRGRSTATVVDRLRFWRR